MVSNSDILSILFYIFHQKSTTVKKSLEVFYFKYASSAEEKNMHGSIFLLYNCSLEILKI